MAAHEEHRLRRRSTRSINSWLLQATCQVRSSLPLAQIALCDAHHDVACEPQDPSASHQKPPYALHAACAQGQLEAVKNILEEARKTIFGREKEKETEDSKSSSSSAEDDWQAYLSKKDERGRIPLVWAVAGSFVDIVVELLRAGADPTFKDEKVSSKSPIMLPLSHSPDIPQGNTYLHIAMIVGTGPKTQKSVECIKVLLEDQRVSKMINERNGVKVLYQQHHPLAPSLISLIHPFKETPLHCACRNTNIDAVLLLLEHGADIEAFDQYSRTPAQTLALKG